MPDDPSKLYSPVDRGRKGGKIGGRIRAANMTEAERKASASLAARARWSPETRAARLAEMNKKRQA